MPPNVVSEDRWSPNGGISNTAKVIKRLSLQTDDGTLRGFPKHGSLQDRDLDALHCRVCHEISLVYPLAQVHAIMLYCYPLGMSLLKVNFMSTMNQQHRQACDGSGFCGLALETHCRKTEQHKCILPRREGKPADSPTLSCVLYSIVCSLKENLDLH